MARAVNRAAEVIEARAARQDERMAHWRKDRPRDPTPIEAKTPHQVSRQLRQWAEDCLRGSKDPPSARRFE